MRRLRQSASTALFLATTAAAATINLDGMAYDCGGILVGFQRVSEEIDMLQEDNGLVISSEYQLKHGIDSADGDVLQFTLDEYSDTPFLADDLFLQDNLLLSFFVPMWDSGCHVVSLDFHQYSGMDFLGLQCPPQQQVQAAEKGRRLWSPPHPAQQLQRNHLSLGLSGDVALRSPLISASAQSIRDSYGVYTYQSNGSMTIYFGPQQGQPPQIWKGRFETPGTFFIESFKPEGPCVHDGQSTFSDASFLHYNFEQQEARLEEEDSSQQQEEFERVYQSAASIDILFNTAAIALLFTVDTSLLSPF